MSDEMWDLDAPLQRYKGESAKANGALQDYVLMGPGRSLRELHRGYCGEVDPQEPGYALFSMYCPQGDGGATSLPPTKRQRTLQTWSARYHWQARVARYEQLQNDRRLSIREARRQELEDKDWYSGHELRTRVHEFLEKLPVHLETVVNVEEQPDGTLVKTIVKELNASLTQISQALKAASDLQRLSTDEPTDITEIRGAALLAELVAELDKLAAAGEDPDPESDDDAGTAGPVGGDPESESEGPGSAEATEPTGKTV